MNRLTDDQIDKIIKDKFKNDNQISDKANSVFKNFNIDKNVVQFNNNPVVNAKVNNNEKSEAKEKIKSTTGKVIEVSFYHKLNRFLSVAAVSLTVVLVGGSILYFNGNGKSGLNNQTQVVEYKNSLVKNEKLEVSNEKVLKEVNNGYLTVYLLGKRDIGVNLSSKYWNEFGQEMISTDCYKVENVTENVSDIFIGEIGGAGMPYVFLLMEDGTIQYIDLHCYSNNVFYFEATKLEGLDNVVGLEQKSRKFSYSNTDYEYVNAIRNDGVRKEIEIGMVNNWNDRETVNFNRLNEKYIKAHNNESIIDDGKGDFTIGTTTYLRVNGEKGFVYCMKNSDFYKVKIADMSEECLASGVGGYIRDNADGRISVMLTDKYEIYSLDKNVIFKDRNNEVINKISGVINQEKNVDLGNIIGEWEESYLHVYLRDDGGLSVKILENGLKKLGLEGKTTLKENVIYNIMPASSEKSTNEFPSAKAEIAIIGKVGPKQRLSIVYYNANKEIVTIDVEETIKGNDFESARASAVYDIPNCKSLEVSKADTVLNGEQLPPYDSVFAIVERDGKIERIEAAWCE